MSEAPIWVTLLLAVIGGGVGLEVVKSVVRGWRDKMRAAGLVKSETDALKLARSQWSNRAFEMRQFAIEAGAKPPELPTTDAYTEYQQQRLSITAE